MKKQIIFDARWIGAHGIGRFASEITKHIPQLTQITQGKKPMHPLDGLYLDKVLKQHPNALFFSPGINAPLFAKNPFVITVHDLYFIDMPESSSFLQRLYCNTVLKRACRRSQKIFTDSAFSKQRIVDWSGVSPDKVVQFDLGVDPNYTPQGKKHEPGYPYLLCISNRRPHKNEPALIQAFAQANLPDDIKLVFSGNPSESLTKMIATLKLQNKVVFAGRIPEEELPNYYRGALGFVFPSLYEGFGLPPIEAMACGCPVAVSDAASLPEVCGDAGILFNPRDTNSIKQAIEQLVHQPDLRQKLIRKGIEQAQRYDWQVFAKKIEAELQKVVDTLEG